MIYLCILYRIVLLCLLFLVTLSGYSETHDYQIFLGYVLAGTVTRSLNYMTENSYRVLGCFRCSKGWEPMHSFLRNLKVHGRQSQKFLSQ